MNTAKTGQLIAAKRKEAGLTQEKLAEKNRSYKQNRFKVGNRKIHA